MEEKELIYQVKCGNSNAMGFLVSEYKEMCFSLCVNLLEDRVLAEDVCQVVFIKVHQRISAFNGQSQLRTWIYRICYNKCLDELKKKKRFQRFKRLFTPEQVSTSSQTHSFENKIISEALKELADTDKAIITFYYLEEMDYTEIAAIIGINANSLKTRLFRARKKLRTVLEKRYGSEIRDMLYER